MPIAALVALAGPAHAQADPWWNETWPYRSRLQFDNPGGPVDDLVVQVVLVEGVNFQHADAEPAGADLRFVDPSRVEPLAYEIEAWDDAGTSRLWVRVPRIESGVGHLWMYYGSDEVESVADPAATWLGYELVHHFPGLEDSAVGRTATERGDAAVTDGLHGGSGYDIGLEDALEVPDQDDFDYLDGFTVSATVRVSGWTAAWAGIVTKGDQAWRLHRCGAPADTVGVGYNQLHYDLCAVTPVDDGQWHHVAATWDGASFAIYVDGVQEGTLVAAEPLWDSSDPVWIGNNNDFGNERGLEGTVDEVRLTAIHRSADWLALDARSLADTLVTWCSRVAGDLDQDGVCDEDDQCPGAADLDHGDADTDSWLDCADCGPLDPGVHPGAAEVAGDGVDQDCDGNDDPVPVDTGLPVDTGVPVDTGAVDTLPTTDPPTTDPPTTAEPTTVDGGDTGRSDRSPVVAIDSGDVGCGCASAGDPSDLPQRLMGLLGLALLRRVRPGARAGARRDGTIGLRRG